MRNIIKTKKLSTDGGLTPRGGFHYDEDCIVERIYAKDSTA